MVTDDQLRQIMPNLPQPKRATFLPFLQQAMSEFDINTPLRQAAFLAQIAHESGQFRFMEEIWGPTAAQRAYEPPSQKARGLGNTQQGDGRRYKGRGPIQITGRANYQKYGSLLGLDLVNSPEQAATPEVGFRTAGLYWKRNGCNELADGQQFITITKRINGGTNGLADRQMFYERAKRVLGVAVTRGLPGGAPEDLDAPAERVFTRGLDSAGETTPVAAERNGPEPDRAADSADGRPSSEKSAGGGAKKPAAKKPAAKKSAAKKSSAKASAKASARPAAKKAGGNSKAAGKTAGKAAKKAAGKGGAKKSAGGASAKKGGAARKGGAKVAAARGSSKSSTKKAAAKGGAKTSAKGAGKRPAGKTAKGRGR